MEDIVFKTSNAVKVRVLVIYYYIICFDSSVDFF